jgi:L-ascorbate metabolism protein UlaG (beta-lactamase superfamily)
VRRFHNLDPAHRPHTFGEVFRWSVWDRLTGRRKVAPPGPPAPWVRADPALVHDRSTPRVTWIGHSSFLATMAGTSFLIDPVFSSKIARVIPRHGRAGLQAADLPAIAAVLVTHNHYDHLDEPSMRELSRDVPIVAPLRLGAWFVRRGFTDVRDLAWWDGVSIGPLTVTLVPARHWSRRRLADINETLWGGYVIRGGGRTLYHAGDTARFAGFEEMRRRFPSIDLALLPIGAYAPAWFMEEQHMNPEHALEALAVLGAKAMVPIHWGAFQLTDEPISEPVAWLTRAWEARRLAATLEILPVGGSLVI